MHIYQLCLHFCQLLNSYKLYVSVSNFLLSAKDRQPNAFGAKIEVPSKLKINKWRAYLTDYDDKVIRDFLQYGWPITIILPFTNQTYQLDTTHLYNTKLLWTIIFFTELAQGVTEGPFDPDVKLFQLPIHSAPLMTVPKKGSKDKQRVVLDFNYLQGSSINDGIPKDSYLDEPFHLHLPGSQTFINLINLHDPGCLFSKLTYAGPIARYRSIRKTTDIFLFDGMASCILTLFSHLVYYQPLSMACQRTANACFIYLNEYGHIAINYIDDFGAAAPPDQAQDAFSKLKELLTEPGVEDSPDKELKPTTDTHDIFRSHL